MLLNTIVTLHQTVPEFHITYLLCEFPATRCDKHAVNVYSRHCLPYSYYQNPCQDIEMSVHSLIDKEDHLFFEYMKRITYLFSGICIHTAILLPEIRFLTRKISKICIFRNFL